MPLTLPRKILIVSALAAAALVAAAQSPTAHADPIAEKRAQAERVERQIHEFDAKLGATIERYNRASGELDAVRKDIEENITLLKVAKHNLVVAQRQLSVLLVAGYKGAGSDDLTAYVLAAGSFSELLDRVEMVKRSQEAQSELLAEIERTKAEIEERQVALERAEKAAERLVAKRAAEKRRVEAALAERQQLLESIRDDVRRLIEERERRQEAAAEAAAARRWSRGFPGSRGRRPSTTTTRRTNRSTTPKAIACLRAVRV